MKTTQQILDAFRDKMTPVYKEFTPYTVDQIRGSLIHNTHLFVDVKNIRVTGSISKRRVSAHLTALDTRTNREFMARYVLTYNGTRYRVKITEIKK